MSVLLETSLGDLVIDLEVEQCPKTCENFLKLCKVYYYNLHAFFNGASDSPNLWQEVLTCAVNSLKRLPSTSGRPYRDRDRRREHLVIGSIEERHKGLAVLYARILSTAQAQGERNGVHGCCASP